MTGETLADVRQTLVKEGQVHLRADQDDPAVLRQLYAWVKSGWLTLRATGPGERELFFTLTDAGRQALGG